MKKLAIIGASYLQQPLIEKAKEMGIETHVFAWKCGDVGEMSADYFYPISIVEKEKILEECKKIGIDGICSIASDLAVITVNYVAQKMNLVGNSLECTEVSTNKHKMRKCFEKNGDPSPKSLLISDVADAYKYELEYPVIVKPLDRSGSRGITKVWCKEELESAILHAKEQGFQKSALIEEFVEGKEYSVECISWEGKHYYLATTQKYTTGEPNYIEVAHLEPANISEEVLKRVKEVVFHALNSLGIKYGASHTELKIDKAGRIALIEIGGRMGGDCIGSSLVEMTTGVDFVREVINVALGYAPNISFTKGNCAAIRFILSKSDIMQLETIKKEHPEILVFEEVQNLDDRVVTDSSNRLGYYIIQTTDRMILEQYMPCLE